MGKNNGGGGTKVNGMPIFPLPRRTWVNISPEQYT